MKWIAALVVAGVVNGVCLGQGLPQEREWRFWAREAELAVRTEVGSAVRVEHKGEKDWALQPQQVIEVKPEDVLEFSAEMKVMGKGDAGPSFVLQDEKGQAVQWVAGFRQVSNAPGWTAVRSRVVVPAGVAKVLPRIVGNGQSVAEVRKLELTRKGNVMMQTAAVAAELKCQNETMAVVFETKMQTFALTDRRTGRTWKTRTPGTALFVTGGKTSGNGLEVTLLDGENDRTITMKVALEAGKAEALVTLASSGEMPSALRFPGGLTSQAGDHLVLPMNEGIAYPAEDPDMPTWNLITYGGHGICMAFAGITDGKQACMMLIPTADDAGVQLGRSDGLGWMGLVWEGQRGQFGYERQMRFVLLDSGGHVAMAKRYRQHAQETGLLKTFTEKRKDRPKIDLLIGAANIWCWDPNAAPIVKEMQEAGIDRILWSNKLKPEMLQQLNAMPNVLTSRYDIYQDLMDPAQFPKLRYTHPDWTTEGFPKDIILNKAGKAIPGWEIEAKDGSGMIPCAVLCDIKAPEYAIRRIGTELKTHPYRSRFIDTTTASPWRECYHPDHPMTRTQSRVAKMRLLEVISKDFDLVCGSETGHDAAVPYCDYFEGMLSLGPYRVPDSGRNMQKIYDTVPERVAKFQVGEKYRLPLWELVYHDACVSQWYWGDYNNKLPAIWRKRDLFNALYGTPPMYMFNAEMWRKQKEQFVESYKIAQPVSRMTGYSEMTNHEFLTSDRSVQRTTFANGVKVTVNFGEKEQMGVKGMGVTVEQK